MDLQKALIDFYKDRELKRSDKKLLDDISSIKTCIVRERYKYSLIFLNKIEIWIDGFEAKIKKRGN